MDEIGIYTNSNKEDENVLGEDSIEYFLMTTYDDGIPIYCSNVDFGDDFMSYLNQLPTMNYG